MDVLRNFQETSCPGIGGADDFRGIETVTCSHDDIERENLTRCNAFHECCKAANECCLKVPILPLVVAAIVIVVLMGLAVLIFRMLRGEKKHATAMVPDVEKIGEKKHATAMAHDVKKACDHIISVDDKAPLICPSEKDMGGVCG